MYEKLKKAKIRTKEREEEKKYIDYYVDREGRH